MTRVISRRGFLAGVAAAGVAGSLALAGCATTATIPAPSSGRRLRMLNWSDYVDDDVLADFIAETGYDLDYDDSYEDNDTAWNDLFEPALRGGRPVGRDIVVPTYWLVARLVARGALEALPRELIPNHANLDPAFLTMSWDRGARFHLPWQSGITGIAYNPRLTDRKVPTIADLFAARYKGKVGVVTEMRETVPMVMLLQGADPSRPTEAAAGKALDALEAARASGQITRYTGNEFRDALQRGEFALCLAWSGDIVQLQQERPDLGIEFVVPEEGGIRWFDSMVIPRGAANAKGAAELMNFVYDPAVAARLTATVQYVSPVLGVRDALERLGGDEAKLATSPILFPDDETKRRLYTWGGLPEDAEARLEARFAAIAGG